MSYEIKTVRVAYFEDVNWNIRSIFKDGVGSFVVASWTGGYDWCQGHHFNTLEEALECYSDIPWQEDLSPPINSVGP